MSNERVYGESLEGFNKGLIREVNLGKQFTYYYCFDEFEETFSVMVGGKSHNIKLTNGHSDVFLTPSQCLSLCKLLKDYAENQGEFFEKKVDLEGEFKDDLNNLLYIERISVQAPTGTNTSHAIESKFKFIEKWKPKEIDSYV